MNDSLRHAVHRLVSAMTPETLGHFTQEQRVTWDILTSQLGVKNVAENAMDQFHAQRSEALQRFDSQKETPK